jgi:hypothetical protein
VDDDLGIWDGGCGSNSQRYVILCPFDDGAGSVNGFLSLKYYQVMCFDVWMMIWVFGMVGVAPIPSAV